MELSAFKNQLIPFSPKLLRFANRMLGNPEEARDIVQDVFLKLWLMREKLATYRSPEALAMTITRNLCIDLLRRSRTIPLNEGITAMQDSPGSENTEAAIEGRDSYSKVMEIVMSLPEQQRSIIHLRDIEGYSSDEIMEILGINANTMRVNLSRARKRVREELTRQNTISWTADK